MALGRFKKLVFGTGLNGTDNGDDSITVDVTGAPPTGAAGGSLDGTYPNPGIAASVAGNGLSESSNVLAVNVDGSTLEISADALQVKNAGIGVAKLTSGAAASGTVLEADGAGAASFLARIKSLCKSGSTALTGAVTLTGGSNVTLTQTGQDITIAASVVGGGAVDSVNVTGDTPMIGAIVVAAGTGISVAQDDVHTVTITNTGGAGVATDAIWDAAGDLVQATGADAAVRLAIGSEGRALMSTGTAAQWNLGGSVLLYDYTVAGSDKASIDTGVNTPDAGIAGTSAFSGAYRVLEIWLYARTDEATAKSAVNFTVNNTGGTSYDQQKVEGANTTASAAANVAAATVAVFTPGSTAAANVFGMVRINVPNYAGTVGYKVGEMTGGMADTTAANNTVAVRVFEFRSTAALTRFAVAPSTGGSKLKVGSRLVIYAR